MVCKCNLYSDLVISKNKYPPYRGCGALPGFRHRQWIGSLPPPRCLCRRSCKRHNHSNPLVRSPPWCVSDVQGSFPRFPFLDCADVPLFYRRIRPKDASTVELDVCTQQNYGGGRTPPRDGANEEGNHRRCAISH